MWKCKECGSTDIICSANGTFTAEGTPNKYGNVKEFDDIQIQNSRVTGAMCNDCYNDGYKVEDIAEWLEEE